MNNQLDPQTAQRTDQPNPEISVEISCPHCDERFPISKESLGRSMRCPICRQLFTPPNDVITATIGSCPTIKTNHPWSWKAWGALFFYGLGVALSKTFPHSTVLQVVSTAICGAVIGMLLGIAPYLIAEDKGFDRLAMPALITTAIAGALLGLWLSIPIAVVLSLFFVFRKAAPPRTEIAKQGESK